MIVEEIDPADGTITKSYIHANGRILAQRDGDHTATRYFYLHDRLGSVRQIINSSGSVRKYCTFEPFGQSIESGGTFDDPFGFTGQYFDAEIGEYYLRARQYNPTIARFTARDPVFGEFEQPLALHKYLYCLNDPVNSTDPRGEFVITRGVGFSVGAMVHHDPFTVGLASISVTAGHFFGLSDDMEFFYGEFLTISIAIGPDVSYDPGKTPGIGGSFGLTMGYDDEVNSFEEYLGYKRGKVPRQNRWGLYRDAGRSADIGFGGIGMSLLEKGDISRQGLRRLCENRGLLETLLALSISLRLKEAEWTWAWNPITIGPLPSHGKVMPY